MHAPEQPFKSVIVWDFPLRIFHWSLVLTVTLAAITGYFAPAWLLDVHVVAGYAIGCLLVFRIAWGFFGGYYSRFNSFPLRPGDALNHFLSLLRFRSASYAGHNPLGAWMIVALLALLALMVVTGLVVLGGQKNLGPLAPLTSYGVGYFFRDFHEALAGLLLGAIGLHLSGVLVEVKIFHHPVLRAMVTGKKPVSGQHPIRPAAGIIRGGFLFALTVGALLYLGSSLGALPSDRWRPLEAMSAYASACGECHDVYHPSLETSAGWRAIMENLSDHFGEDASLDTDTTQNILAYLAANDAMSFDTEVANRIGRATTDTNRKTDTRYWKKRHDHIDEAVFKRPTIGSKVNCAACHKDATAGLFNDRNIAIPDGDKK